MKTLSKQSVSSNTKVYWINRTKGKVGSDYPIIIRNENKADVSFPIPKADANDKFDLYFIEEEWLNDIKNM